MMLLLSATVILLHSFSFIHLTKSASCNVTAEYSMVAVDLAQLHISDDSDILCLLNLESHIGALAINSVGRGLVVDSLLNSRILFLVPLTLWDDSNTNATEWQIDDAQCWLHLRPILGFSNDIHEMDIGNHLQLKAELYINDAEQHIVRAMSLLPEYFWYIHLHFEVPGLFHYTMEVTHTLTGRLITLELWQQESYPTLSNVRMLWMHAPSLNCTHSQLQITIRSGCPSQKGLKFIYPQNQTDSELARLPVNYRPPSPLGSSLPTSPHVYNADPSRPLSNTHFEISQNAVFKHCYGKPSRAECNCSDVEEHDVADSDCINKVYRHPYQQKFQLDFTISLGGGHEEVVTDPVSLMEVNGRTSFTITGLKNDYVLPDSKDSVRIKFEGPGLFHFQATVVTNSSFCNLTTYFTVFVDRAPLMKASEYSIIVSSTVVFGAVVAFMYLLYHFRLAPDNMHK